MMNLNAGLILDPQWIPFVRRSANHVTKSATYVCQEVQPLFKKDILS